MSCLSNQKKGELSGIFQILGTSIVKYDAYDPAINTTPFPKMPIDGLWSSSPYVSDANYAWQVFLYDGSVYNYLRHYSLSVRLVRASQSLRYWPSITVIKNGTGAGTVSSNPKGINCGRTCISGFSSGQKVTLNARPASVFLHWEGDCTGTKPRCTITVEKGKYVTAVFSNDDPYH